ncbi:MAG: hypothetical protein WBB43_04890 [Limnoraphis sp.]
MQSPEVNYLAGRPNSRGILYYAKGERWIKEALQSAQSVKAAMPNIKTAIVSDTPLPKELFDIQIKAPDEVGVKQLKMWSLRQTPFEKTIYLDTDTYIADSIWELFEMLNRFEIALAVTPRWMVKLKRNGGNVEENGVPVCFPNLNTGVIVYQKNQRIDNFFSDWAKLHKDWGEKQDQPPFRNTLYHSDIRFGVLPSNYNYRLPYPDGIWGNVKIFHGHEENLSEICQRINYSENWRITSPRYYHNNSILYGKFSLRRTLRSTLRKGLRQLQRTLQVHQV